MLAGMLTWGCVRWHWVNGELCASVSYRFDDSSITNGAVATTFFIFRLAKNGLWADGPYCLKFFLLLL